MLLREGIDRLLNQSTSFVSQAHRELIGFLVGTNRPWIVVFSNSYFLPLLQHEFLPRTTVDHLSIIHNILYDMIFYTLPLAKISVVLLLRHVQQIWCSLKKDLTNDFKKIYYNYN